MLCERCKKKKAVMFYNENVNGKLRSFNLCADCAAAMQQSGELEDLSTPFSHFLSPFVPPTAEATPFDGFFALPLPSSTTSSACPLCHTTWGEVIKRRQLGCPTCYTAFSDNLAPTLLPLKGAAHHAGRVPRSHRRRQELAMQLLSLKEQLKEAIETEQFETAASLRDKIKNMEAEL